MTIQKFVVLSTSSWRKSIAITRNLGRKNYNVVLCRRSFLDMACWSKYCYKSHKVSDKNYFQDLIKIGKIYIKKNGDIKPVLIITEDNDLKLIFDRKEKFLFIGVDVLIEVNGQVLTKLSKGT